MRLAHCAVLAALLAACAPKPETPEQAAARLKAESDTAKVAIMAADARQAKFFGAGQMDSAAANYTEDATFYPDNMPAARGRAAIRTLFQNMGAAGTWQLVISTYSVEASGPIAIETGRGLLSFTPGPKAPPEMATASTDTIKYVTTWRKVGGQWMITNDISNSDRPAQPAPARRR